MKTIKYIALTLLVLLFTTPVQASNYARRTDRTGGTSNTLDNYSGALLNDGDRGEIFDSLDFFSFYCLDASSGASENSPFIISPDTTPGSKRWLLQWPISGKNKISIGLFSNNFATAKAAIGSSDMTLLIDANITLTEAYRNPNNIVIERGPGGLIKLGNYTLTFVGGSRIVCPSTQQIFSYSGSGTVSGLTGIAYANWFGAKGDGSTDDSTEIQYAVNTGALATLAHGTYKITDTITVSNSQCLKLLHGVTLASYPATTKPAVRVEYNYAKLLGEGDSTIISYTSVYDPNDVTKCGVVNIGPSDKVTLKNINWCTVSGLIIDNGSGAYEAYVADPNDTDIDNEVGLELVSGEFYPISGSCYNNNINNLVIMRSGIGVQLQTYVNGNSFNNLNFYRLTLYGLDFIGASENNISQSFAHASNGTTLVHMVNSSNGQQCIGNSLTNLLGEPGTISGRYTRPYYFETGTNRTYFQGYGEVTSVGVDNGYDNIIIDLGAINSSGDNTFSGINTFGKIYTQGGQYTDTADLISNTNVDVFNIALPDGNFATGEVFIKLSNTDNTNYQTLSQKILYRVRNRDGIYYFDSSNESTETLGADIITNGTNWTDTTPADGLGDGWETQGSATFTNTIETGDGFSGNAQRVVVTGDTSGYNYLRQAVVFAAQTTYKFSMAYRSSVSITVELNGSVPVTLTAANTGNAVTIKSYKSYSATRGYIQIEFPENTASGSWFEIDSVSLEPVTANSSDTLLSSSGTLFHALNFYPDSNSVIVQSVPAGSLTETEFNITYTLLNNSSDTITLE